MALQHLRSNTASKRPTASSMSDGQLAINTNATSPGLFFKDAGGALIKVGPVHIGTSAPNSVPAGSSGNAVGEQWLDTSGGGYVLKIWDGTAWRSETGQFVDVAGDTMTGNLTISGADLIMSNGEIVAASGSAATPSITFSGDLNTGFYKPAADEIAISTGGTGRVFVDSSGNVGIGTTSPDTLLHLEDVTPELRLNSSDGTLRRMSFAGPGSNIWYLKSYGLDGSFNNSFEITQGSDSRLFLQSGGNVGIGTTSPGTLLHLSSATGSASPTPTELRIATTTTANDWSLTDPWGRISFYNADPGGSGPKIHTSIDCVSDASSGASSNLFFNTTSNTANTLTTRLTIEGDTGNVGIGTTSPVALLTSSKTVNGGEGGVIVIQNTGTGVGTSAALYFAPNNGGGNDLERSASIKSSQVVSGNFADLEFLVSAGANPFEAMRINTNGNVGIGLTSPQTPLHVNGLVRINTLAGTGNRAVYSGPSGILINSSSDATLKTNVTTLGNQLEVVKQLRPVTYNWIDTEERGEQQEIGFIAQEVQHLVPQVIGVNHDETLSVDYPKLTAVLTKALQEAMERIETLEAKVAALEAS